MASTNAPKIQDPEKLALAQVFSSSVPPRSNDALPLKEEADHNTQSTRMSRIRHLFFCCVLLALLAFTFASASHNAARKAVSLEEKIRFQELLDTVEPAALHDVLHKHMKDKYQHGVFQEDRTAMEAVHQSNAEVAQSLVELAKRQSNATTSASVQSSSAVLTIETTTTPIVMQSTPASTSPAETQTTTTAAQHSSQAPTGTLQTTAVVASTSTPTVASTTPATTEASSPTEGPASTSQASPTSSSLVSSSTPGNDKSSTTSPAPTSSRTQSFVYTTTQANGVATTITSITVVPAEPADNTGSVGSTKTTDGATLQTNGANALNLGLTGVLGAIGVVVVGAL